MSKSNESESCENNGVDEIAGEPQRPRTPDTCCSICLDQLFNKCCTDVCGHSFCYKCLKQWSTIESSCPLCKRHFKEIRHSFTKGELYRTYDVAQSPSDVHVRRHDITSELLFRRRVYAQDLWAETFTNLHGHYFEIHPEFFGLDRSYELRLREFVLRDVTAVMALQRNSGNLQTAMNEEALATLIVRSIMTYPMNSENLGTVLQENLGHYAAHFYHEIYSYAISPNFFDDYDNSVRYFHRRSNFLEQQMTSDKGLVKKKNK